MEHLPFLGVPLSLPQKKEDKILAAIPILFGIQQAFEGIQWLYLNSGSESFTAGYFYLFFALILWPIFAPICVYVLDKKERKTLLGFVLLGIAVSIYFFVMMLTHSLAINKINACIDYSLTYPFKEYAVLAYSLAITGSLFISSIRIFRWFGIAILFFGIISLFFFTVTFTSVWCFFAAVISSMFLLYIKYKKSFSNFS